MYSNKKFILELLSILGPIPVKEALLGKLGYKVSRLGINPKDCTKVLTLLDKFSVKYVVGNFRYTYKLDVGKGGWSNKFSDEISINDKNVVGDYLLYISDSIDKARIARNNEEKRKEIKFGEDLGIPSCCANFYISNSEKAMEKQNDFVLYVLENTLSSPPYNYWNNYIGQYFGYSLLSFFPCSFDCEKSIDVSKKIYDILYKIYPDFANKFLLYHKQNILYTEYRGIYLFQNTKYKNSVIKYSDSLIHSTIKKSSIYKTITQSNKLFINNKNDCTFLKDNITTRNLRGENVALCLFN